MARRKPSKRKHPPSHKSKSQSVSARRSHRPHDVPGKLELLWGLLGTAKFLLFLLVLVTIIAYANAWPNNLVGDDPTFAVTNRYADLDLASIARFFSGDVWGVTGFNSGLYRPLLLVSIMIDTQLFGDWVAGYHLSNIFFHVLTTLLLFGLIRHLLLVTGGSSPLSDRIAILAAMVFGVHPIHTEVINSIFNRSEMLVSLGIIGGLWWFLRIWNTRPKLAWTGLSVVYLLVLFCRESGATLPALAVLVLWITLTDTWQVRLKKCLPCLFLLIPFAIYLSLRAHALGPHTAYPDTELPRTAVSSEVATRSESEAILSETMEGQIGQETVPDDGQAGPRVETKRKSGIFQGIISYIRNYNMFRLQNAVSLWADSLKLSIWPHPLRLYHGPPDTPFWLALGLQVLLLSLAVAAAYRKHVGLLAGLAFFYIAILPSSGVVGSLPFLRVPVAERFLYLPSVGLTITLAFGLEWLAQKFSLRTVSLVIAMVTIIMIPLNWARNAEWATDIKLNEAEYRKGAKSSRILGNLVMHNLKEKNIIKALEICDEHYEEVKSIPDFSYNCGMAFENVGRFKEAASAYTLATESPSKASLAYLALALMQVKLNDKSEAKENFEHAIALMDEPFLKDFHTALMLIKLNPHDQSRLLEAKGLLERAIDIQPQYFPASIMLDQLNEILGPGGRFDGQISQ